MLSVGVPVFDTVVRIVGDDGTDLPPGQIGELVVSGPQVIGGYWRNPRADAEAFVGGELRTGDIGFMDTDGWFYVIDRKSEIINASGFKVWPNEVERSYVLIPRSSTRRWSASPTTTVASRSRPSLLLPKWKPPKRMSPKRIRRRRSRRPSRN